MALPERLPRVLSPDDSAPIPDGAILLGIVDGIEFVQFVAGGPIWQRAWGQWSIFCTAAQWPSSAFYAALMPKEC